MSARLLAWLPDGMGAELRAALDRITRTEGVVHVAVMPDAHVAEDVCVGTVAATTVRVVRRLTPVLVDKAA